MVSSPKFYEDRKISGTTQRLLCLIQRDPVYDAVKGTWERYVFVIKIYDPVNGTCERLPLPPIDVAAKPLYLECVAVNRKLVLMVGFHRSSVMKSVYIYDFESARWSRRTDMPTPRFLFACSVDSSTGLVYVAGGFDERRNPLAAAEAYNVEEDKWETLPPMIQPHGGECDGVFMEGKFMVLSGGKIDRSVEVFDPSVGTWRTWEDMIVGGYLWRKCAVSSGELYIFSYPHVMKYDGEKNVWTAVASFPQSILSITCATQWGDWIFVSGAGFCKKASYLFSPTTGQWIEVNGDGGECCVVSAATVEI
jgi:hypothetical protein